MPTSFYFTRRSSSSSSKPTSGPHQTSPHNGPMKSSTSNGAKKDKVTVKYKECRKNHAASIGGYAVDGCREFMAAGEEGTKDALRCAACSCHRSFHKRVVEGEIAILDACDCSSGS